MTGQTRGPGRQAHQIKNSQRIFSLSSVSAPKVNIASHIQLRERFCDLITWQGDNHGDDDVFGTTLGRKDMKDKRGPKKSLEAKLGRKGESNVGRAKLGRKRRQDSDTDEAGDD